MGVEPKPDGKASARQDAFLADVLEGLSRPQKTIPPKYFYDHEGSRLFDEITTLPEYYLTRAEIALLRAHGGEIAARLRGRNALVEFGSGSARKARLLLAACPWIGVYAPCDISADFLADQAEALARDLPAVRVAPVVADFGRPFSLPARIPTPRAALFLGSTIGNFDPAEARDLLRRLARALGADAMLVIGVDLEKDPAVLERAYDDARGVTARFNLNLLGRMNRELGADFQPARFSHRAVYNQRLGRIEMHLVSRDDQVVRIAGRRIAFAQGESIHTENSYKYTVESFLRLAWAGGWNTVATWTGEAADFSVHALAVRESSRP